MRIQTGRVGRNQGVAQTASNERALLGCVQEARQKDEAGCTVEDDRMSTPCRQRDAANARAETIDLEPIAIHSLVRERRDVGVLRVDTSLEEKLGASESRQGGAARVS